MSFWDYIAPIAGSFLGGATGLPFGNIAGAAIGSGVQSGLETGSPLRGLASAAGAGGGAFLGSQLGSGALNGYGATAGSTTGPLGGSIQSSLGDPSFTDFGSQTYGDSLAAGAGGAIGGQVASSLIPPTPASTDPTKYTPVRQAAMALPGSLSQYGSLSPDQELSGIATKGVYGGGNSPDENKYFLNLVNNRLVDTNGQQSNQNFNPVETSYLSQLGLNPGDTTSLLKGIQNYQ